MPGIDYTKRYRDYARFTPAISEMYTRFVTNTEPKRPCPVPQQDLDFLDPNSNLFHISSALYSAGQAAKSEKLATTADCMVTGRDKGNTIVLGDSGGFQIQTGAIKFKGDETRERMMRWMETNCDWSMILDFPTGGINMGTIPAHRNRLRMEAGSVDEKGKLIPDTGYGAELDKLNALGPQPGAGKDNDLFNTCLLQTLVNNDWFVANRKPGATKFLNVVQGRNPSESKFWYDKVKHYPFEGWSLAGPHKENLEMALSRIIEMRDEGLLQDRDWMHFLGVGKLQHGCAYTTMQRCIREHINPNFTISYDVSSPFTLAAYGKLFLGYTLDKRGWGITGEKFDGRHYLPGGEGAELPFLGEVKALWETKLNEEIGEMVMHDELWSADSISAADSIRNNSRFVETEIGKKLRMDQVCVNADEKFTSTWDVVTYAMMMNHNVQVHMEAVFEGQDLYDRDDTNRVPAGLLELKGVIQEVFTHENPMDFIRSNRKILNYLSGAAAEDGVLDYTLFDMSDPKAAKDQAIQKKKFLEPGYLTNIEKKAKKKAGEELPKKELDVIRDPGLFG